jgi:hypothetical protein
MRRKKFLNDREAGNTARGYQKSTPWSFFFAIQVFMQTKIPPSSYVGWA